MADKALLRFLLVITPMRADGRHSHQQPDCGQEGSGPISVMRVRQTPHCIGENATLLLTAAWQPASQRLCRWCGSCAR
eukprot:4553366-Prymnesium_polylepis.1